MQFADYNDSVFINCPFDRKYQPILRAIVFAIYGCGFLPETALKEDNGLENRLEKIQRCIQRCKYGIHDISRTQLSDKLPRFNMPFELGIFFGAKRFGEKEQKVKNALIFDVERYRYQKFISDLNGVDIKAHDNTPYTAIAKVRDWLSISSKRGTVPGSAKLVREYKKFEKALPLIVKDLGFTLNSLPFDEYCTIVEETLKTIF